MTLRCFFSVLRQPQAFSSPTGSETATCYQNGCEGFEFWRVNVKVLGGITSLHLFEASCGQ